jgi:phage terminase small subunit
MQRPSWLTDPAARKYWDAHAPILKEQGILTDLTLTSFAMLAQTFADWRAAEDAANRRQLMDNYLKLATKFGVIPHITAAKAMTQDQTERTIDPQLERLLSSK